MENNQDKLITFMTFDNGFQAHLLKCTLADHGIESHVIDENIVTLNPLYNNLIGGIKLMISSADIEKAQQILKQKELTPLTNDQDEILRCPKCNSERIETNFKSVRSVKSFFAILIAMLTVTYPMHVDYLYYCLDCKKTFRK
jgi:DNA-directed RNA polymerase subunit RPC12/RpoP